MPESNFNNPHSDILRSDISDHKVIANYWEAGRAFIAFIGITTLPELVEAGVEMEPFEIGAQGFIMGIAILGLHLTTETIREHRARIAKARSLLVEYQIREHERIDPNQY